MIEIVNITKHFDDICALNKVSATFPEGDLSVITGTSGSGKSTLIRIIGGIVRPDGGVVIVDDMPVYDNVTVRKRLFLVPDEPFCPGYMTARGLAGFYATQYEGYDEEMLRKDLDFCDIPMDIPLRKTDKDLRSLVHLAVGVSLGIKYLICDDIFTGMSEKCLSLAGRIISEAVSERSISVVIALEDPAVLPNISGNTYELETVC